MTRPDEPPRFDFIDIGIGVLAALLLALAAVAFVLT